MNIDQVSITNQKISIIKLHLEELDRVVELSDVSLTFKMAYKQGAFFHSYLGYIAFLNEVANHYAINEIGSFSQLAKRLESKGIVCQYTELLADLEDNPESWLGWLVLSYQDCLQLKQRITVKNTPHSAKLDNIILTTSDKVLSDEEKLHKFYDELQEIIYQFRQLMQEW